MFEVYAIRVRDLIFSTFDFFLYLTYILVYVYKTVDETKEYIGTADLQRTVVKE